MHAHRRRTPLVIAAAVAIAVAVAFALVLVRAGGDDAPAEAPTSASPTTATPTTPAPSTTPSPAPAPSGTPAPAPDPAEPPATAPPAAPPAEPGLAAVQVVTTYAGWNALSGSVEVGAYAATVESPGTCTLVLTGPTGTVERPQPGVADASTVSCGGFAVPRAELAAGTWQAHVEYASAKSAGSSEIVEVQVP